MLTEFSGALAADRPKRGVDRQQLRALPNLELRHLRAAADVQHHRVAALRRPRRPGLRGAPIARLARPARSEKGFRLAQTMQVGPYIPVGIQV